MWISSIASNNRITCARTYAVRICFVELLHPMPEYFLTVLENRRYEKSYGKALCQPLCQPLVIVRAGDLIYIWDGIHSLDETKCSRVD